MLVGLHEILKILPMAKAMFEMEKNSISEMFLHFLAEEKWFPYLSIQNFKFLWQLQMWTEEARLLDSLLMFPVYAFIVSASGSQKKNQNGRHLKGKNPIDIRAALRERHCPRSLYLCPGSGQSNCILPVWLSFSYAKLSDPNWSECNNLWHKYA